MRNLRKEFGLSVVDYDRMFETQGGRCDICGETQAMRLAVDHDHSSGRVRALLCTRCNGGLGNFRDRPELLREAINYLGRHGIECSSSAPLK